LLILLAVLASSVGLIGSQVNPASAANTESTQIGMPFSGAWAYNVPTSAGCGPGSGQTAHPSCHELYGYHWATDVYAGDGTDVKLNLGNPTGALAYTFVAFGDGGCGHRVVVNVKVDTTWVGQVYFDHLKNEVDNQAELNAAMSGNRVIGEVDQTCHVGFAHAHMGIKNISPSTGYSCYINHSVTGTTAGMQKGEGTTLGWLGANGTAVQQVCSGTQPGTGTPVGSGKNFTRNGGFNAGGSYWVPSGSANFAVYSGNSYEGSKYGATNAAAAGDSIRNDYPLTLNPGDAFCAEAMVRTAGGSSGASGTLAVWLMGGSNENNTYSYSNLPGSWTPISTCVTATAAHTKLRVQFYPAPGSPTLNVDAVDTHYAVARNGSFESGGSYWAPSGSANFAVYSGGSYDGSKYAATNTAASGDSIYNDRALTIGIGDSFCVEAQVRSSGGGSVTLAVWLMGGSNENGSVNVGALNAEWRTIRTCVTATATHNKVRVQFYSAVGGPTVNIDAVDSHRTIADNGSFTAGGANWSVRSGGNFAVYGTGAYEGPKRAATNAFAAGGGILQDINMAIASGDSLCAEAMVRGSGAQGAMALWLLGGANENSTVSVGTLTNEWRSIKTCVMATSAHTKVRVQFYPTVGAPTWSVDAVGVH
jgi:hypothetical protein